MIHPPDDFPKADYDFVNAFTPEMGGAKIPDGAIVEALVATVSYINPDTGLQCWLVYNWADLPVSQVIGLLEMSKLEILARTPGAVSHIHHEEDDDA